MSYSGNAPYCSSPEALVFIEALPLCLVRVDGIPPRQLLDENQESPFFWSGQHPCSSEDGSSRLLCRSATVLSCADALSLVKEFSGIPPSYFDGGNLDFLW